MPLHSLVYLALTGCHVHLWCSLAHIFPINNILDFEKWGSVIAWRHSVVPKNWPLCAHGLLQEDAHGLFGLFWWMPVGRTAASKGIRIIRMIHVHYRLHTPLTMLFARGLFKWDSIFPGVRSTSCKGQNQIMLLHIKEIVAIKLLNELQSIESKAKVTTLVFECSGFLVGIFLKRLGPGDKMGPFWGLESSNPAFHPFQVCFYKTWVDFYQCSIEFFGTVYALA